MSTAVTALDTLLRNRHVWRGRPAAPSASRASSGWPALDAALPTHGWPEAALSEILCSADGMGELQLLWPALKRLTQAGQRVVLVAPPYLPNAPAWAAAGIVLEQLAIAEVPAGQAAWTMEQCLRSGACAAVLGWLAHADNHGLRRLQLAAATGNALGFVFRGRRALANTSPAALRLEVAPRQLHIHKCRGGGIRSRVLPFPGVEVPGRDP